MNMEWLKEVNWLEWMGYLASVIVLVSLIMSSIVKLRWINLVGSMMYSAYGFMIGSLPVAIMNLFTSLINVYYLIKIYRTKESFTILPAVGNSEYFNHFLDFYKNGIQQVNNKTEFHFDDSYVSFFILRNMVPAGIFVAKKHDEHTLDVELDFVIPEYRDFKVGSYIYEQCKEFFLEKGYSRFVCYSEDKSYVTYLEKMGFVETEENGKPFYVKSISKRCKIG